MEEKKPNGKHKHTQSESQNNTRHELTYVHVTKKNPECLESKLYYTLNYKRVYISN